MNLESTAFHVFGALGRAIGRVFLWFFILLVVGFGGTQGVALATSSGHKMDIISIVTGVVVGLVLGYAAALTVIVGEVVRILVGIVRELRAIVKDGETDVSKVVGRLEGAISGKKQVAK